jgi:hypothetical protein
VHVVLEVWHLDERRATQPAAQEVQVRLVALRQPAGSLVAVVDLCGELLAEQVG